MNQQCEQFEELISGLVDGELTVPETERVINHLDQCATCQQTKAEFEMIDLAIQSPEAVLNPRKNERTNRKERYQGTTHPLRNHRQARRRDHPLRRIWMPVSLTSVALLAVGASIFWPTEQAGAETTEVNVPSLELGALKTLNQKSKENTDSILETIELQLRIMRLEAKSLDGQDPNQAAIQSEIEKMMSTLSDLKSN